MPAGKPVERSQLVRIQAEQKVETEPLSHNERSGDSFVTSSKIQRLVELLMDISEVRRMVSHTRRQQLNSPNTALHPQPSCCLSLCPNLIPTAMRNVTPALPRLTHKTVKL